MINNLGQNMKGLRRAEKRALYKKITAHVSKVLKYLIEVEEWTAREIYDQTGVPQNRLSEILHYDKYQRPIGEFQLNLLISGGVLSVNDIMERVDLTEKERNYIQTLSVYEDPELLKIVPEVVKKGGRASDILKKWLEEK